ncbi:MAG: NFACT family protein [Bacilli bacterium]|jgi:predicted ribosome quality control (RQC) complex YloA/Tae2 family protein
MRLSQNDFRLLIDIIRPQVIGQRLRKITFYSSRIFYFQLSKKKESHLVVNLDNANPSVFVCDLDNIPPPLVNPLYVFLKKELNNAYVKDVVQINDDRVIRFEFEVTSSAYKASTRYLIIELISAHPNFIITDGEEKILNAFRKNTIDAPRIVARGFKYEPPAKAGQSKSDGVEKEFSYIKYVNYELSRLHQSSMTRNQEKFIRLFKLINSRIRSSSRKIDNIKKDVLAAEAQLHLKDDADAILTLSYDKKWHTDEIKVNRRLITLDKTKTLAENVQHFYKLYKKAKSTIEMSEKLIEDADKELRENLFVKDFLMSSSEEEIDRFVAENKLVTDKEKIHLPVTKKYAPYSIESKGAKFFFGKTADQNDYLSFVYANRQHIWLHLLNQPGAHVVISKINPSDEDLVTAAEIALLCSSADRGEVMYAFKRDVTRGETKGEAHVKKYETIYVSFIRPATEELFKNAVRLKVK